MDVRTNSFKFGRFCPKTCPSIYSRFLKPIELAQESSQDFSMEYIFRKYLDTLRKILNITEFSLNLSQIMILVIQVIFLFFLPWAECSRSRRGPPGRPGPSSCWPPCRGTSRSSSCTPSWSTGTDSGNAMGMRSFGSKSRAIQGGPTGFWKPFVRNYREFHLMRDLCWVDFHVLTSNPANYAKLSWYHRDANLA